MASTLQLSVRAVEDRRARLMKKVQVRSVAELIQMLNAR
jgi:FixJ family two-component response regulator